MGSRGRGAAGDVRLHGRVVVVADDDPGVTWFISDLLRTAGCEVYEALDGQTALETAFRVHPELVVSDILMPGLDGFALSRALRRDVALRDVPVILLSWKEDLLQRVRELGASAAAYMRKESDSRSILARVREVLRPRARIEMRLRGDGEVRGRLDGLTPRLLLELVGAVRKDARVSVRDATCLYEIEIRNGAPRKATRTASDGSYVSGERAVATLLGVGAGRFVVTPSVEPIRGELAGSLFEMLARPIASARGAVAATTGARAMQVERIVLDAAGLAEYLSATPDPARTLVQHLARGASPRQMLLAGEVSPSLLEDVLVDLSARGSIRAVEGPEGEDFLGPAVEASMAQLAGGPRARRTMPPNARPSVPAVPAVVRPRARPQAQAPAPPSRPPPTPSVEPEGPPSSLEDAVMREISDRSPTPGEARIASRPATPIVEPSQLRKRPSSNPPDEEDDEPAMLSEERTAWPSIPPDAVVPATAPSDEIGPASSSARQLAAAAQAVETTEPPQLPVAPSTTPAAHEPPAPPVAVVPPVPEASETIEDIEPEPPSYKSPFDAGTTQPLLPAPAPPPPAPAPPPPAPAPPPPPLPLPKVERTVPLPAVSRPAPAEPPKPAPKRRPWAFVAAFAILGVSIGAVVRMNGNEERADGPTVRIVPVSAAPATASVAPVAHPSAPPFDPSDLPPGAEVPPGFGLVEVATTAGSRVRIDGAVAGTGPIVDIVAAPGFHEVRIDQDSGDDKQVVEVRAGKTTRVRSAPRL
jgi:CheY-like chemotaxis protein